MMITRLLRACGSLKTLPLVVAPSLHRPPIAVLASSRTFSTDGKGGNGGKSFGPSSVDDPLSTRWSFSQEGTSDDGKLDVFGEIEGDVGEVKLSDIGGEEVSQLPPRLPGATLPESEAWDAAGMTEDLPSRGADIFEEASRDIRSGAEDDTWETAEGFKPWTFGEEDGEHSLGSEFASTPKGLEGDDKTGVLVEQGMTEEEKRIQREEAELSATLKGPNRAFGDLVAASGITEDMLDSLIALKDFEGIEGLPPLKELEDLRLEKSDKKSTRAKMEQQKQEEMDKLRVRKVDEKGRSYGTGRRKCSVARVWIQPGNGNFTINGKEFNVYFPILDHQADLLKPFAETKTLGMWDVKCTVKGGGVSGQAGAVRLGISRALQN